MCCNVFSSVNILVAVVRAVVGSVLGHRMQGEVEEKDPHTKHRDIASVETVVCTICFKHSVYDCIFLPDGARADSGGRRAARAIGMIGPSMK